MSKYITKDKVLEFISRMWDEGIKVDADPTKQQLTIHLGLGKYEWIQVFDKNTYNEMVDDIISQKES